MNIWSIEKQGEYGQWAVCKEPSGIEVIASHASNLKTVVFPYKFD